MSANADDEVGASVDRLGRNDASRLRLRLSVVLPAVLAASFVIKGLLLPSIGFGDLWFNTDVARGAGHDRINIYDGIEEQLDVRYAGLAPSFVAPYGPAYYYPIWMFHGVLDLIGAEDADRCDAECELSRRPAMWGFLAKLPHLIADAACVAALLLLLPGRRGLRAALAWATAPGLLYVTYVMGQNDIFPLLTIVTAFGLIVRSADSQRPSRVPVWIVRHGDLAAMVVLGIGGAMKVLPLLFAPMWALAVARRPKRVVGLTAVALLTTLAISVPFVGADYFARSFLFSQRMVILLSQGELGFSPLLLIAMLSGALVRRSTLFRSPEGVLVGTVALSAALGLFTEYNPQRAVYLAAAVALAAGYVRVPVILVIGASAPVWLHPLVNAALGPGVFSHLDRMFGDVPAMAEALPRPAYHEALRLITRTAGLAASIAVVHYLRRSASPSRDHVVATAPVIAVPTLALALGVAAVVSLPLSATLGRWGPPPSQGTALHALSNEAAVLQPFAAPHALLERVDLFVDPSGTGGPSSMTLDVLDGCDSRAEPLATARSRERPLFEGRAEYVAFALSSTVARAGQELCLRIGASIPAGQKAHLVLTSKDSAQLARDGDTVLSGSASFRDRYVIDLSDLVGRVSHAVVREVGAWLLAAASGAAASAGAVLLARRRLEHSFARENTPA